MPISNRVFLSLCLFLTPLMSGASEPLMKTLPCATEPGFEYACNLRNPEDMVYFPPTGEVIFSQLGGVYDDGESPLGVLNVADMSTRELLPDMKNTATDSDFWGEACEPIAGVNGHGIDLSKREDGRWQLLVVNHNHRESVEFFEVTSVDGRAELTWRGCVAGDEYSSFNDVAALPDGGFLVSQMMPHERTWAGKFSYVKVLFGFDTGGAHRWAPGGKLQALPGSSVSFANGLNVSADGKVAYLNGYSGNEMVSYELASGVQASVLSVRQPDNNTWDGEGRLLVASQHGSFLESLTCLESQVNKNCVVPFSVVAFEPKTGDSETVFAHQAGKLPIATVALEVGDDLLLGTYSGDRIVKVLNYRAKASN